MKSCKQWLLDLYWTQSELLREPAQDTLNYHTQQNEIEQTDEAAVVSMVRLHTFILQQLGSKVKVLLRGNEQGWCVFVVCKTLSPYCFSILIAACVYPGLLLTLARGLGCDNAQ